MKIKKEKDTKEESPLPSKLKRIENDDWIPEEQELVEILELLKDVKDDENTQNIIKNLNMKTVTNLLVNYRATRGQTDLLIFDLLSIFEKYGVDLSILSPLVFGEESKGNYDNLRKLGSNLHVRISPDDAIKVYLNSFTIWNTLKYHVRETTDDNAEKIYDVRFILRYLYAILQPASMLSCKLFVEQNCLSLLFSCTSSSDVEVRTIAYACLQRYVNLLQELKMEDFAEKSLIGYLIRLFKHSYDKKTPKISSVITHFFGRVAKLMLHPEDKVYPQIMAFLSMKPIFDIENVPEFYKLLFSSSPQHHFEERQWILTLLSEAILEPVDYQVLQNRAGMKLLLTSFASNYVDKKDRSLILKILQNAITMPTVAHDLFAREGLHLWIVSVIDSKRYNRWEKNYLAQIFCDLLESERNYQRGQKGKEETVKSTMAVSRICSKKMLNILKKIEVDTQFEGEQVKAKVSIDRIEKVIGKTWKMKKKYRKI